MKIGILALQGAVQPHAEKLKRLDTEVVMVRTPQALKQVSGLILPGGESTTMIHLLKLNKLWGDLAQFGKSHPILGVCAGAILLANKVDSPAQESLGLLDIEIERNAYGRQIESFIGPVQPSEHWHQGDPIEAVFIRAPRFKKLGPKVQPLFFFNNEPVMVENGNILAATFHPELSQDDSLHEYFVEKVYKTANLIRNPRTLSSVESSSLQLH